MMLARLPTAATLLLMSGYSSTAGPQSEELSFGSLASSPVVVTGLSVNGTAFGLVPLLVDGRSDEVTPRANAGAFIVDIPPSADGKIRIDAVWVEVMTGRAFNATAAVPARDLDLENGAQLAPIFGPNGQMLITSDPVPSAGSAPATRDLVSVCGTRSVTEDRDYRVATDSLPDLAAVIADTRPEPDHPRCPVPQ